MTLSHIRALAEEYALKYNPDNVAPFPYENIVADHPDLKIYFTALDDDDISGATLYKDSEYSILINTNKPATRQHFTLGHELGHYFLHQDLLHQESAIVDGDAYLDGPTILYRLDDVGVKQLETEANNFAASLIMPADLVRRAWEAAADIEECARIFNVSPIAMTIRLMRLGLISE
jgi:Zn-dependent peptidase ImmA (M78 family)